MDRICLTIAGSDSGGGAGIQADLKTFAALGVHGLSVITSVTSQNTCGVEDVYDLPSGIIKKQLDAVHTDFEIHAAKTGMLATSKIIKLVARSIGDYPLVVDPVMVATSGDRLQRQEAVDSLKEQLLPAATVVTPNIYEAEVLSGIKIRSMSDARRAAAEIGRLTNAVVITGGHLGGTELLYHAGKFHEIPGKLFPGRYHGSGCTFSAAVAAYLGMGYEIKDAVVRAKQYTTEAIRASYTPGQCSRVLRHLSYLEKEAARYPVLTELESAVEELLHISGFVELIPEVGVNFVHSLPGATKLEDIAGIRGRIVKAGSRAVAAGCISFGASRHMGRVVLAASSCDRRIRSAMNIRHTPEVIRAAHRAGLSMASFSRSEEPEGVSTMEWGTLKAVESHGSVPDIIYDTGWHGKEPMVRILGENPAQVLAKLKKILQELHLN
ncbi:bifunctional hydroxymethylpyrimidine kinase/phosphomethylpyrimidine kinase [Candidatus Pyrohabitans sp.]